MSTWDWIIVAVAVAVATGFFAVVAASVHRRNRSRRLREQFGSEYARVVDLAPSRKVAEEALAEREERHRRLDIQRLPVEARERYGERWRDVQARFVDDPGGALHDADRLVGQVLAECGYPYTDFEQRVADVSVEHRDVVANFRAAHDIYERHMNGSVSTEELRHAMVDYRSVLDEVVEDRVMAAAR